MLFNENGHELAEHAGVTFNSTGLGLSTIAAGGAFQILVLVPSLTLLQQTLREWSEAKLLITAKAISPTLIGCGCDTSYSKTG